MSRPPRIDFPDAVYHVTSRGNGRAVIFSSDADRQRFLAQLADGLHVAGVVLYAYVLLGVKTGTQLVLLVWVAPGGLRPTFVAQRVGQAEPLRHVRLPLLSAVGAVSGHARA